MACFSDLVGMMPNSTLLVVNEFQIANANLKPTQWNRNQMEILATDTREKFDAAVKRAVELLRAGEVVALPTETVYGLAANALNAEAVQRIFQIKGRPPHNPIIVHVASRELASQAVSDWNDAAEKLAKAFWPGPLTLVLPKSTVIPGVVTAGGNTVGVRWPSHPFIQAVIRECGFPLAAPSANPSSRLSPTAAEHVATSLGGSIPLIVDGGPAQVGIESTVVDISVSPARLLRPGIIHRESLMAVLGALEGAGESSERLKSPGMLAQHYSPRARLVVRTWSNDTELAAQTAELPAPKAGCCVLAYNRIPDPRGFGRVSLIPHDPEAYARALYAELHKCDELGAELIIVEAVPATAEWDAIADRLRRAEAR
jgi:L-threonylcarbamoyladenylate synthase